MGSIQDTAYLKLNKWRTKILKQNQQKELNLMCKTKTNKKIRNYKLIFLRCATKNEKIEYAKMS